MKSQKKHTEAFAGRYAGVFLPFFFVATVMAAENTAAWQITRKIPLPAGGQYVDFCDAGGVLWGLRQDAVQRFVNTNDGAGRWETYLDKLPGQAWCFHVEAEDIEENAAAPSEFTIYVGMRSVKEKQAAVLVLKNRRIAASWKDGLTPQSRLTSIVAVEDENADRAIFVADAGMRNILRFDSNGKFLHGLYKPGELIVPSPYLAMAIGRDGLLRVVNPGRFRIEAFHVREDGTEIEKSLTWGVASTKNEGFAGCCNPAWLAVLADGSYLTSEKRFHRVKQHDAEGKFLARMSLPPTQKNAMPEGFPVAAFGEGFLLVNPKAKMIYYYEKK